MNEAPNPPYPQGPRRDCCRESCWVLGVGQGRPYSDRVHLGPRLFVARFHTDQKTGLESPCQSVPSHTSFLRSLPPRVSPWGLQPLSRAAEAGGNRSVYLRLSGYNQLLFLFFSRIFIRCWENSGNLYLCRCFKQ